MLVPNFLLQKLYTKNSLKNNKDGYQFSLKNRLLDAKLVEVISVTINSKEYTVESISIDTGTEILEGKNISKTDFLNFPIKKSLDILVKTGNLAPTRYDLIIKFRCEPIGAVSLKVSDELKNEEEEGITTKEILPQQGIPRDSSDNYSEEIIRQRQSYLSEFAKHEIKHLNQYSFDAHLTQGNCENFIGVAQVPIGLAGPIKINGEEAKGDFLIPMATTEGTLVASYNRGIKAFNLSGGVKVCVADDGMQRAPVFGFQDASEAKKFIAWLHQNMDYIKKEAEATSNFARLLYIDHYLTAKYAYLRFGFTTGDAAGQNMVNKATFAACNWIIANYQSPIENFYLESNMATDKKASLINTFKTRGKRVIAEVVLKRDILEEFLEVSPESLHHGANLFTIGSMMSGSNNNGAHTSNAIAAIFIATGQDLANMAESCTGILYTEVTKEGDLYGSITLPSLIVGTYGGGTNLPTQRECLEIMGCYGAGKVRKFAEIIASVALAGELSLGAAIATSKGWVDAHEEHGRNR